MNCKKCNDKFYYLSKTKGGFVFARCNCNYLLVLEYHGTTISAINSCIEKSIVFKESDRIVIHHSSLREEHFGRVKKEIERISNGILDARISKETV
jgi:predicted metallo-beta-lactamase superfamily hydrolase